MIRFFFVQVISINILSWNFIGRFWNEIFLHYNFFCLWRNTVLVHIIIFLAKYVKNDGNRLEKVYEGIKSERGHYVTIVDHSYENLVILREKN